MKKQKDMFLCPRCLRRTEFILTERIVSLESKKKTFLETTVKAFVCSVCDKGAYLSVHQALSMAMSFVNLLEEDYNR